VDTDCPSFWDKDDVKRICAWCYEGGLDEKESGCYGKTEQ